MKATRTRRLLGAGVAVTTGAWFLALAPAALALPAQVEVRDNVFRPEKVQIDPGDTVTWVGRGSRPHNVQSDEQGQFNSGDIESGETFSHRFDKEGNYFYFCKYHGSPGMVGMAGWVRVGNPPPPEEILGAKDQRPTLVVPDDFPTIQAAVDNAHEGSAILIKPGVYKEDVVVETPDLVIEGVDRFRTILHGEDKRSNGITIDGANDVTVRNLTVRNFTTNGIFFNNAKGYVVNRVDAIKNRVYGVYAFNSYEGVFKNSFGWGSGDSAFYVGQCLGCSALLDNLYAAYNYLGYSGTNATGVVIRNSTWTKNGAGIVPNTLPTEDLGPNRGTYIVNNKVFGNNYETIPAAGFSETAGIPFGTGIWLAGVQNNVAIGNEIRNHKRYGVLVTHAVAPDSLPFNNEVLNNRIRNSGIYDLAWDGTGANNCFSGNDFDGATGPPLIQTLYGCDKRPFVGVPFAPVLADWMVALSNVATRSQEEPPEPKRPSCQKGAPGCNR